MMDIGYDIARSSPVTLVAGAAFGQAPNPIPTPVAAVEPGTPEAACVAVTVWLALLKGDVGVNVQALLTTVAVPTCVPSMEMVTVSPLTPPPDMIVYGNDTQSTQAQSVAEIFINQSNDTVTNNDTANQNELDPGFRTIG